MKRCGFCAFSSDDAMVFDDHVRQVHRWGAPAAPMAPAAAVSIPVVDGVAKFCGSCGAPRDAVSTNFCRSCGAAFVATEAQPAKEASPAFAAKAGFWRRTAAYLLDSLVVGAGGLLVGFVVGLVAYAAEMAEDDIQLIAQLIGNVGGVAYFVYFWSGHAKGQTPGMRRMNIRVIRTDGTYASVGRAFLREIGLGIGMLCLGLGVFWVAFDKQKQGWHDKMADTYVISVRA
ncbi:MAG: RDD family protein [Chloroflexota bacterium]